MQQKRQRRRPPAPSAELAALVRQRRESFGYSRAELARLASLDDSTIGRLERGQRRPDPDTLSAIAIALRLRPEELQALARQHSGKNIRRSEPPDTGDPVQLAAWALAEGGWPSAVQTGIVTTLTGIAALAKAAKPEPPAEPDTAAALMSAYDGDQFSPRVAVAIEQAVREALAQGWEADAIGAILSGMQELPVGRGRHADARGDPETMVARFWVRLRERFPRQAVVQEQ